MAELSDARPEKLSIVVFSGDFYMVHYALLMASAAAAIDIPPTLFFTMGASRSLLATPTVSPPALRPFTASAFSLERCCVG